MIVEGWDDHRSVIGLMKAHVDWPDRNIASAPVFIHRGGGASDILRREQLGLYLKSPVIKNFGIMLDADLKAIGRYNTIRTICKEDFPRLPDQLEVNGTVVDNEDGKRLGVWIMPDNGSHGALEEFLQYLVPPESKTSWDFAGEVVKAAVQLGCPCHEPHLQKAKLYTWLAWQNPPAQDVGMALTKKILDPSSESARVFVQWFQTLYELQPKSTLFG